MLNGLTDKLSSYLPSDEITAIEKAYLYSEECHVGQLRESGDPYITHPVAVASILADMKMDHESLMAALLHDVIEDTGVTKNQISRRFGRTVASLVDGVSKLSEIETASRAEQQADSFQKMTLAMSKDIRVVMVKLADRLHNMRTIKSITREEKRKRIAQETMEIYAPLADRMGMNRIRDELEDLSFSVLNKFNLIGISRMFLSKKTTPFSIKKSNNSLSLSSVLKYFEIIFILSPFFL